MTEEPLQFGEGGRLFGILSLPGVPHRDARELPVFVFLNAGLLHRVGPYRLYVRLVRKLADMGFNSLRVDLAGRGDSPARSGLTNEQSVAADYEEIVGVLESRLGRLRLVLGGLCAGADNAIRLAPADPRVIGMLLLDPVCSLDDGFRARAVVMKYTNPARYLVWLKRRLNLLPTLQGESEKDSEMLDPLTLRDQPTGEQLRAAFEAICERRGRVLSVFTRYATRYYNQLGQFGRTLDVAGYQRFCTELFWPQAAHTYTLELHRRRLIEEIKNWAGGYIRP
ncbi:MAG: serine aminopeptidase domain-containing protein [Burkholderiales bacterium]